MAAADNRNRYLASDRIARESREWARIGRTRDAYASQLNSADDQSLDALDHPHRLRDIIAEHHAHSHLTHSRPFA